MPFETPKFEIPEFQKEELKTESPKTEQEIIEMIAERNEKRVNLISAACQMRSMGEKFESEPLEKMGRIEIRNAFREEEQEVLEKLEILDGFKISPSEKINIAEAYLRYKNTAQEVSAPFQPENFFLDQIKIHERITSLLSDGVIVFNKKKFQEYRDLKGKENKRNYPENRRFFELTDELQFSFDMINDWGAFPYCDYEPFDPKLELERLKLQKLSPEEQNLPKEKRREIREDRLKTFKENLFKQKEALADLQNKIIEKLGTDAEQMEKEQLTEEEFSSHQLKTEREIKSLIGLYAHAFQFSPAQVKFFEDVSKKYFSAHKKVEELRRKYPEDDKLFQHLFGDKPRGRCEIKKGPINFYIKCFNLRDFAKIRNFPQKEEKIKVKDIIKLFIIGGTKIKYLKIPELENAINAENSVLTTPSYEAVRKATIDGLKTIVAKIPELKDTPFNTLDEFINKFKKIIFGIRSKSFSEEVQKHETQHSINALFKDKQIRYSAYWDLKRATAPEKKIELLKKYMGYLREEHMDFAVKNEILAFYKDGAPRKAIMEILTESKAPYDYFNNCFKEFFRGDIKAMTNLAARIEEIKRSEPSRAKSIIEHTEKGFEKFVAAPEKEIFVKDYHKMIKNCLDSMAFLEKKGYSKDQIVTLLLFEHPHRWSKLAKRIEVKK